MIWSTWFRFISVDFHSSLLCSAVLSQFIPLYDQFFQTNYTRNTFSNLWYLIVLIQRKQHFTSFHSMSWKSQWGLFLIYFMIDWFGIYVFAVYYVWVWTLQRRGYICSIAYDCTRWRISRPFHFEVNWSYQWTFVCNFCNVHYFPSIKSIFLSYAQHIASHNIARLPLHSPFHLISFIRSSISFLVFHLVQSSRAWKHCEF